MPSRPAIPRPAAVCEGALPASRDERGGTDWLVYWTCLPN